MTITKTSEKNILTQLSTNDEIIAPLWLIFRHDPALSVYPKHGHAWGEFIYAFNGVMEVNIGQINYITPYTHPPPPKDGLIEHVTSFQNFQ